MIAAPTFAARPLAELALPPIDAGRSPQSGQPRRIGEIMPEVLARYGLTAEPPGPPRADQIPPGGMHSSAWACGIVEKKWMLPSIPGVDPLDHVRAAIALGAAELDRGDVVEAGLVLDEISARRGRLQAGQGLSTRD